MKAAVLTAPEKITLRQVPIPEPEQNEALVKIELAGICGSDHSLYHGNLPAPLPVIPGHEAVGRIECIGPDVSGISVGQRVTIQPNFSCGRCALCRAGHINLCSEKIRLGVDTDGVFAEFVKVPVKAIWPVPDGVNNEVAVLAEPVAVAAHALKIMAPQKGERTLIIGMGVIGLLVLQLAALTGTKITACDFDKDRLSLAKKLGAAQIVDPKNMTESFQNRFDLIYETCGAPVALSEAVQVAAPRGKIVLVGLPGKPHPVASTSIVRKELQILGSIIYTDEFPYVLDLLERGRIDTRSLVTDAINLNGLGDALSQFNAPGRVKITVSVS